MGELVGERYEIRDEIGRGGTATVFRAYDVVLERFVALKLLAAPVAESPEFLARLEREAQLAARLDHPNIVTIFDFGRLGDGRAFIAMRLLEGKGLDRILEEEAPLPGSKVASIVGQIAAALDYTHAGGTVHRDVKPSNVIVDSAGHATLSDFGIARAFDSTRLTLTGVTIGTPQYMAPEQLRGEELTGVTDVYALGVLAFEMLAGRPPFEGQGTALIHKIAYEEPPAVTDVNAQWGRQLADVVRRALEKNPAKRWPSAGAFAQAIDEAVQNEEAAAPADERSAVPGRQSTGNSTQQTTPSAGDRAASGAPEGGSGSGRTVRPTEPIHSPAAPTRDRRAMYIAAGVVVALVALLALFFLFGNATAMGPVDSTPAPAVEDATPGFEAGSEGGERRASTEQAFTLPRSGPANPPAGTGLRTCGSGQGYS